MKPPMKIHRPKGGVLQSSAALQVMRRTGTNHISHALHPHHFFSKNKGVGWAGSAGFACPIGSVACIDFGVHGSEEYGHDCV
jgi:hypothetical protein